MFDNRSTPYIGILYAALIGTAVIYFVPEPGRPLGPFQIALFYALSYLPGLGFAMLGDPAPQRAKAEYLKIDFYAPKPALMSPLSGSHPTVVPSPSFDGGQEGAC